MVTRQLIKSLAMRYDTTVARAFRRALGIPARRRAPVRREEERRPSHKRGLGYIDPDLLYCFRNEHPVMDGVHK